MNETDVVQAELEAMKVIVDTLRPLTPESIKKVLRFVNDTYPSKGTVQANFEKLASAETQENQSALTEFHELFDAARPETGAERALVAGYWLQVLQANEEWDSFMVNKELKNLGWPASNITRDLDNLVKRIPRWVHHRKEGTSQQGRKTYTLTTEGKRAVQRMLADNRTSTGVESNS